MLLNWLRRLFSPKSKGKARLVSRDSIITDIEDRNTDTENYPFRAIQTYSDNELWDMGWHDAQWHSKPNPRYDQNVPYMKGWNEAR